MIIIVRFAAVLSLCLVGSFSALAADGDAALPHPVPIQIEDFGGGFILALGGKLYDDIWTMTGVPSPPGTHPSYPKSLPQIGPMSRRCVACHGWDYSGKNGERGKLGAKDAFVSLRPLAGQDPKLIEKRILAQPHDYPPEVMSEMTLSLLSLFVSLGQFDQSLVVDVQGRGTGDPVRGRDIFEGACMNCHQPDGKAHLIGEHGDKSSLGWISRNRPEQALHKILYGVPSAEMLSLRFMLDRQVADLFAYLQTLDAD